MRTGLAMIVLCTSCTRYAVTTRPTELAFHASEVVTRGAADVYDPTGKLVRVSAEDPIEVSLVDGNTQRPARMTVRELVSGCVPSMDAATCLAKQAVDTPATLRSGYRFDGSRFATGLTFGVMGAAIGGCLATCQGSSELQRDLTYGGVAVAGAMALFVLLIMVGGGG